MFPDLPSRIHRTRGTLSMAFLIVTLGLAGALAYNAQAAARSHRTTVENTLRDYAGVAAWEFRRRARDAVASTVSRALGPLRAMAPLPTKGVLPTPAEVQARVEKPECGCNSALPGAHSYFRVDMYDDSFSVAAVPEGMAKPTWLADSVLAQVDRTYIYSWRLFTRASPSTPGGYDVVAYTWVGDRRNRPRAAYGFVIDFAPFEELFATSCSSEGLIPPAIARGRATDSLLSIAVLAPDRVTPIFQSPAAYELTFSAFDTLGVDYGGLVVRAAVRPDAAAGLIIGGLPRSRLPLVIGLMVLTLGVGMAALTQIRREHQLARLRDDFVSGVSHELRTPLAQIRMFGELLDNGRLRNDRERGRSARVINRESRRLTHLVENLLHFSRLRRASTRLSITPLDLSALLDDTVEAFAPLADARATRLVQRVEDHLEVDADRDALHQIVLNLLDNALKYGPEGQTVTLGVKRVGDHATLWVEDEGPGIPRRSRERIWNSYHRLERDANTTVGGSGIGLSVVRELATLHGGTAWVEDGEHGARFLVTLPGARDAAADADALDSTKPTVLANAV